MSPRTMVKKFLDRHLSERERAERALGLWLAGRNGNATKYISETTGIPYDKVWGIIFGRTEE